MHERRGGGARRPPPALGPPGPRTRMTLVRKTTRSTPRLLPLLLATLLLGGCAGTRARLGVPADVPFLPRAAWQAKPPVLAMQPHVPRRITIHHTAVRQAPARSGPEKIRALQAFSQREDSLGDGRRKPAWADVPYHFYVAADGTVLEGRDARYAGDSNTPYDPAGHLLVVVEGNFEEEEMTPGQRATLDRLVPALARRWKIPASEIAGHRDFAETLCPGEKLYQDLPRLRDLVAGQR